MKIALVTPHFPPDFCGVGDHSYKLATALQGLGHEVEVWTTQQRPPATGFQVHCLVRPWSARSFGQVDKGFGLFKPELVLIQYTPYLFSETGGPLTLLLPLWISWLRARLGVRVGVVAHELHYPVNLSVAGVLRGIPQLQAFSGIALAANHVFFTYEATWRRYQKLLPWRAGEFHWVPVGANIEPVEKPGLAKFKKGLIPSGHKTFLHFGGAHPTLLLPWTFAALEAALESPKLDGKVTLVFAGNTQERIDAELEAAGKLFLKPHIRALGQVSAAEASQWLSRCDVVLAPFLDGVSTRRSSLIAALAHGRPVVTTTGYCTDASLPWAKACAVVAADDADAFVKAALKLLLSDKRRKTLGEAGLKFHAKLFKWDLIAQMLVEEFQAPSLA